MSQVQENEESEDNKDNQYLTFLLGDEEYGVEILQVMELRGWEAPTSIPNCPEYVKGVINIRGIIVPIIDLRQRFKLDAIEYGALTVVIVLLIKQDGRERQIGIVVDAVSEVYDVTSEQLKEVPNMGERNDKDFIKGLACLEDKILILLDSNALITSDDLPDDFDQVANE